jgi:predicted RNase H-like HicB family nuclease
MRRANYKLLGDGTYYGEIPACPGVWGNAATLEECREDLQGALESWMVLGLRRNHAFPAIDGEDLQLTEEVVEGLDTPETAEQAA